MFDYNDEINFYNHTVKNNVDWNRTRIENDGILDYPHCMNSFPIASKVLEIGCGPCSSLHYGIKNNLINVTCVDACADEYKNILNGNLYHPIIQGCGEDLSFLDGNTYDVIFMQNSLDHTSDPFLTFRNCYNLLCNGGTFFICGFTNEGIQQNYIGLHQHNFELIDGKLYYSNKDTSHIDFVEGFDLNVISYNSIYVEGREWFDITYLKIGR